MAKVITITQDLDAKRLASIYSRMLAAIERVQLNASKLDASTKVKGSADLDNVIEQGFKDLRAIEAGYMALTGQKLTMEKKQ